MTKTCQRNGRAVMSQPEVAKRLGLTLDQVKYAEKAALEKLRVALAGWR